MDNTREPHSFLPRDPERRPFRLVNASGSHEMLERAAIERAQALVSHPDANLAALLNKLCDRIEALEAGTDKPKDALGA